VSGLYHPSCASSCATSCQQRTRRLTDGIVPIPAVVTQLKDFVFVLQVRLVHRGCIGRPAHIREGLCVLDAAPPSVCLAVAAAVGIRGRWRAVRLYGVPCATPCVTSGVQLVHSGLRHLLCGLPRTPGFARDRSVPASGLEGRANTCVPQHALRRRCNVLRLAVPCQLTPVIMCAAADEQSLTARGVVMYSWIEVIQVGPMRKGARRSNEPSPVITSCTPHSVRNGCPTHENVFENRMCGLERHHAPCSAVAHPACVPCDLRVDSKSFRILLRY
jgi:hypothetical protein